VLLLHGFGEHTGHYHRLAGQLTADGFEVYGPDHLGHGHTAGGLPGRFASVDELAANAAILLYLMTDLSSVAPAYSIAVTAVTRVRTYGTFGLNRPWDQLARYGGQIQLPMYGATFQTAPWDGQVAACRSGRGFSGG
jgi:Serine aminopeptidase, S33